MGCHPIAFCDFITENFPVTGYTIIKQNTYFL